MPSPGIFSCLLLWAAQNERKLGAVLFAFGFLTDFFTFGILPIGVVNYIFMGYLALAALCSIGAHSFAIHHESSVWWKKALSVIFPLGAQYAFGGLLSGFVVFYTAHSVVLASWPFLIFITLIYIGNEYFRMYKQYLVFQTTLFFFTLYAYTIFGVPLVVGQLGPWIFLLSSVVAVLVFSVFLYALYRANKARFRESFRNIRRASAVMLVAVCGAYFLGVIPPIPLVMKDAGIYHGLMRVNAGYVAQAEAPQAWWDLRTPVIHQASGAYLYAYSAIQAPTKFGSTVVHRWERHNGTKWVTESMIAFPIYGGREAGYRGYSQKDTSVPGKWRVSVETANGQVIGRIRFDVESIAVPPALYEKTL